jgi:hypothetical protein
VIAVGWGLPKKVDSAEGRRRQHLADQLRKERKYAEARKQEKRAHAAWRRDVAAAQARKKK